MISALEQGRLNSPGLGCIKPLRCSSRCAMRSARLARSCANRCFWDMLSMFDFHLSIRQATRGGCDQHPPPVVAGHTSHVYCNNGTVTCGLCLSKIVASQ
jgi:hypothetical protein